MSSATQIKEELQLIKEDDDEKLLNYSIDREKMQLIMQKLEEQERLRKEHEKQVQQEQQRKVAEEQQKQLELQKQQQLENAKKAYVEFWTKAIEDAIKGPPEAIPFWWSFGTLDLEEIPVPRTLEECQMEPADLAWKLEKEKRAEIEKDWPDWLRMMD